MSDLTFYIILSLLSIASIAFTIAIVKAITISYHRHLLKKKIEKFNQLRPVRFDSKDYTAFYTVDKSSSGTEIENIDIPLEVTAN